MNTSEILRAAKARITPERWGRSHSDVIKGGKECPLSAIGYAEERAGLMELGEDSSCDLLFASVAFGIADGSKIGPWNDAPERTLQDVYDAFDAAIAIAEHQEAAALVMA